MNEEDKWIEAEYKEQQVTEYVGNPLIEALPSILDYKEAYKKMIIRPLFNEAERELSEEIRYQLLFRLQHFFQPVAQHIDLERRFSRLIRTGYLSRNPLNISEVQHLRGMNSQNSASSFTLMGFSGIGKTTAIERVLSLYPQVILHKFPINRWQIVWLKLNCPHDGSLKTLCMDFFQKVDELLGTNYYEKFGIKRISISAMITQMGRIARIHCIGALIIDEIQHLLTTRDRGSEKMMNFFVTLINEVGIPIILIGTMKAKAVLQQDFRQARRGSGQGDMVWENMSFDEDWNMLIEEMWNYQWIKNFTPLTDELNKTLYEESQGIVDIAVKIFSLSQSRAIETGAEKITPALLKRIVTDDLKLVKPMLNALKSGDKTELEKYQDIMPMGLSELLVVRKSPIDLRATIQKEKEEQKKKKESFEISIIEKAILALLAIGITATEAEKAVKTVMHKTKELEVSQVITEAIEYLQSKKVEKKKRATKAQQNYLKSIIEEGRRKQQSAYESLIQNGLIKQPINELVM